MPRKRGRRPERDEVPGDEGRRPVEPVFSLARRELRQARLVLLLIVLGWTALCVVDLIGWITRPEQSAHSPIVIYVTGFVSFGLAAYSLRGDDERRKWWFTLAALVVPALGVLIYYLTK